MTPHQPENKNNKDLYFNLRIYKNISWSRRAVKRIYKLTNDLKPDEEIVVTCIRLGSFRD